MVLGVLAGNTRVLSAQVSWGLGGMTFTQEREPRTRV